MRRGAASESAQHLKNSFASETPVTDGERVYTYFGNVGVFAFDMDGTPVWSAPAPSARCIRGTYMRAERSSTS